VTEQLSHLLGVTVAGVSRTGPAHRDGDWVDGRFNPAMTYDGGIAQVRKEMWWIRLEDGRLMSVESRDVRKAKEFTLLLRKYGSRATLNNRICRKVLRLMHEVVES
jgi:hypothetical protein